MYRLLKIFPTILLAAILLFVALASSCTSDDREFNFIFKYGVGAKNELNTFKNSYTKDMISDPSVTIDLKLTDDELTSIYKQMIRIGFFDYPDIFSIYDTSVERDGLISIVTPCSTYIFEVEYPEGIKNLYWEDEIRNDNESADRLRELVKLIRQIIEDKEEYQALPSPRGGYL